MRKNNVFLPNAQLTNKRWHLWGRDQCHESCNEYGD